jgi:hypothetical protein
VHVLSELEVSMEELAGFDVSDIDRYFDVIRLPRDVLVEEYLFNEVLGTHANLFQDTHVILALYLHEYLLPPVLVLDKPRFHSLAAENQIDFFLFFARLRHDDTRALSCLLEFEHPIFRLPNFGVDDLFVLVEDCLVEELSSGGLDGKLCYVCRHQVGYVAVVLAGMEESAPVEH